MLVEGYDLRFLKRFQDLVFPDSLEPIDGLPHMSIGGWTGWPYAIASAMLLKNAGDENIQTYCILDSDYHTPETKQRRIEEAEAKNVHLHIWKRKEIENYLVVPEAIERAIHARVEGATDPPALDEVVTAIGEATEDLKQPTIDVIAQEIHDENRGRGLAYAMENARNRVDQVWGTLEGRTSIVSGKALLSKTSSWSQQKFGVSFGVATLLNELKVDELASEVVDVVSAIEHTAIFTRDGSDS